MHCSLKVLNNGCTFAKFSELLKALMPAKWKYRFHSRRFVLIITADTARLRQPPRLSQYISCLGSPANLLTKRIVGKALSFFTVIVNIWLPFKPAWLVDSMLILSISVFVKIILNNSCGNILLSKTESDWFHAFNCCLTELSMCFQLAVFRFFVA